MKRVIESMKYFTVLFQMRVNLYEYLKSIYSYKVRREINFPKAMVHLGRAVFKTRENTLDIVHVSNFYERETTNFLSNLKPRSFIDVGAHIGRFSILLAKEGSSVVSVEASQRNFKQLKYNVDLNEIKDKIRLVNLGCSDYDGQGRFYLSNINEGANSLEKIEGARFEEIQIKRLDKIIENLHISPESINAIKIDVEGCELDVLKGSIKILKEGSPLLVLELLEKDKEVEVKEFLKNLGFFNSKILDSRNFVFEKRK